MGRNNPAFIVLLAFLALQLLSSAAHAQASLPAASNLSSSYAIFNGTTYINTMATSLPKTASPRSVFAWVYSIGGGTVYSYGASANDELASLYINGGMLSFTAMGNSAQSDLAVTPYQWHLVGYTYAANSSRIIFYLDGASQAVNLSAGIRLDTSSFSQSSIGKQAGCSGPCGNFDGYLSEVRVYDTNLSYASVKAIRLAGLNPGAALFIGNLSAWWPLNGSTLDYSGNGNGGSYHDLAYGFYGSSRRLSILLTPGGSAGLLPQNATYPEGSTVHISALPSVGFSLKNWSCTGIGCYSGGDANATITMSDNITETASFTPSVYLVLLSSSPTSGGTVFIGGNASLHSITSVGLRVPYGSAINISENPNPGYAFKNWSCLGEGCYNGANRTAALKAYGNITETANFQAVPMPASLHTNVNPPGAGSARGGGTYVLGSNVSISAMPNPGFVFTNWSCTGQACYSGKSANQTGIVLEGNITETANFAASNSVGSGTAAGHAARGIWYYYPIGAVVILLIIILALMLKGRHRRNKHAHHGKGRAASRAKTNITPPHATPQAGEASDGNEDSP